MMRWSKISPPQPKFQGGSFLFYGCTSKFNPTKDLLNMTDSPPANKNKKKTSSSSIPKNNNFYPKIAAFDMDDTLIRTKSRKTMPVDEHDWQFVCPEVVPRLQHLYHKLDYKNIALFSNQLLRDEAKLKKVQKKVEEVVKKTKLPAEAFSVFLAQNDDIFRKPCPLMMEFYAEQVLKIPSYEAYWRILLTDESSDDNCSRDPNFPPPIFYVGDAAGRHDFETISGHFKDHSCADRKFAFNAALDGCFFTPEEFFLDPKHRLNKFQNSPHEQFNWSSTKSRTSNPPSWSFNGLAPPGTQEFFFPLDPPTLQWENQLKALLLSSTSISSASKIAKNNNNTEQKLVFICGPPRSGKAVVTECIQKIMKFHKMKVSVIDSVNSGEEIRSAIADLKINTESNLVLVVNRSHFIGSEEGRSLILHEWNSAMTKNKTKSNSINCQIYGIQMSAQATVCKHFNWFEGVAKTTNVESRKPKLSNGEFHAIMKHYEPLVKEDGVAGKKKSPIKKIITLDPIVNTCCEEDRKRMQWLS